MTLNLMKQYREMFLDEIMHNQKSMDAAIVQAWNRFIRESEYITHIRESEDGGWDDEDFCIIKWNTVDEIMKAYGGHLYRFVDTAIDNASEKDDETVQFYKFGDEFFIIDINDFPVSEDTAEDMIQYILENNDYDIDEYTVRLEFWKFAYENCINASKEA